MKLASLIQLQPRLSMKAGGPGSGRHAGGAGMGISVAKMQEASVAHTASAKAWASTAKAVTNDAKPDWNEKTSSRLHTAAETLHDDAAQKHLALAGGSKTDPHYAMAMQHQSAAEEHSETNKYK